MPIAVLKFKLPEENEEFKLANNALNYYCQLTDIEEMIRSELKYNDNLSEETSKALEKIRTLINIYE